MASSSPIRRRRSGAWWFVAVLAMAFALVAGACSSSKSSSSSTTVPPESIKVPMAQVRADLPKLVAKGNAVAAAADSGDFETAKQEADGIESIWNKIEGRIKAEDPDSYIAFEDAQAKITNGVADKKVADVKAGAEAQATQATEFLQHHTS